MKRSLEMENYLNSLSSKSIDEIKKELSSKSRKDNSPELEKIMRTLYKYLNAPFNFETIDELYWEQFEEDFITQLKLVIKKYVRENQNSILIAAREARVYDEVDPVPGQKSKGTVYRMFDSLAMSEKNTNLEVLTELMNHIKVAILPLKELKELQAKLSKDEEERFKELRDLNQKLELENSFLKEETISFLKLKREKEYLTQDHKELKSENKKLRELLEKKTLLLEKNKKS